MLVTPYGLAAIILLIARSQDTTRLVSIAALVLVVMVLNLLAMRYARPVMHTIPLQLFGTIVGVLTIGLSVQILMAPCTSWAHSHRPVEAMAYRKEARSHGMTKKKASGMAKKQAAPGARIKGTAHGFAQLGCFGGDAQDISNQPGQSPKAGFASATCTVRRCAPLRLDACRRR